MKIKGCWILQRDTWCWPSVTFVLPHTVSTSPNWFVPTWWSPLQDLHFRTQQNFPEKDAKLDYLKQLSHFLQLAMGELEKKQKQNTRLRKSLKWLITHNLKSPTLQAFWAKCFSRGDNDEEEEELPLPARQRPGRIAVTDREAHILTQAESQGLSLKLRQCAHSQTGCSAIGPSNPKALRNNKYDCGVRRSQMCLF